MPLLSLSLLLMTAPGARAAEPDEPACTEEGRGVVDFLRVAEAGEAAFGDMDLAGLREAREDGLAILACLEEPVTTTDAAAFHRMMALEAFTSGQEDQVLREFHAARRLAPGRPLPARVAPGDHPLNDLYERSLSADEGALQPTIPPEGGFVLVDGVRGAPRPSEISVIIQVFEKDASLSQSLYLRPEDALPSWGPLPIDQLRRKRRRVTLLSLSGTGLALSGTLLALNVRTRAAFYDTEVPARDAELPGLQARANALGWSVIGVGTATLGLGVATAVVW